MNITDVGHLTSDADSGEDKMLKGAQREQKTVWEIAEFYIDAFKRDLKKLNILSPSLWCRATDHIAEQIKLIQLLEKKGFTYVAGGNVYFNTSKLTDYGKLIGKSSQDKQARVSKDLNKKNDDDFVLWFTKSKFQEQEMKWKSPYGTGYPGWHLECSAMAGKYLGEQFDLHCGGIDHIPVHHTNEIAQSEAAFGKKPWVKYWLHNEFLVLGDNVKMAKSGENFLTLSVLEEKGFHSLDYRYFCLGTHYRKPLMFSFAALEGAKIARRKLNAKIIEFKASKTKSSQAANQAKQKKMLNLFQAEINDDLNTSKALAVMWDVINDDKLNEKDKYALLIKFDEVLGLSLKTLSPERIPSEVIKLAQERLAARKKKDWQKADQLREEIQKKGYVIGDVADGYVLSKN